MDNSSRKQITTVMLFVSLFSRRRARMYGVKAGNVLSSYGKLSVANFISDHSPCPQSHWLECSNKTRVNILCHATLGFP